MHSSCAYESSKLVNGKPLDWLYTPIRNWISRVQLMAADAAALIATVTMEPVAEASARPDDVPMFENEAGAS
jgi:hypothetical protein